MSISKWLLHWSIWISALLVSALLIVFAWRMYPVPDGDAIYFIPAIKAYASTGVVDNKLVNLSFDTDPDGLGRFLFYTPGFPVAMGSAMAMNGASSYQLALIFLSFARAGSTCLFARALIVVLQNSKLQRNRFFVLLASALVMSSGLFLFASNGRPEILSMLLVSISLLAALSIHSSLKRHLVLIFCIGLLFPVSIANGVVACAFYLFYLFIDIESTKKRLVFLTFAITSGSLLIVLSYLAAGLPLEDGFKGLSIHSKMQLGRTDTGLALIFSYWKSWIVFAILSAGCLINALISGPAKHQATKPLLNRLWLCFSFSVLACFIYFFGLRAAPIHYNLYAFLPLYQLLSFRLLISLSAHNSKILRYGLQGALAAGLTLSIADPLRAALLFPYYLTSGSTYHKAIKNFQALDIGECALMYTEGLYMLDESQIGSQFRVDRSARPLVSRRIHHSGNDKKCVVAIVQEVNGIFRFPVGMKEIADHRDRSTWTPKLRALRFLNSPKGYSFSAFKEDLSEK